MLPTDVFIFMAMALAITATSSLSSWQGSALLSGGTFFIGAVAAISAGFAPGVVKNFVHPGNNELQYDKRCESNAHPKYGGDESCHKLVRNRQGLHDVGIGKTCQQFRNGHILLLLLEWYVAMFFGRTFFPFAFEHIEGVDNSLAGSVRLDNIVNKTTFRRLVWGGELG